MTWQENLFSNLLVISILLALAVIVYCKIKDVSLGELIRQIKESTEG